MKWLVIVGLTAFMALASAASAVAQGDDLAAQRQTVLAEFQAVQSPLMQERQALLAGGATSEQLQAWQAQTAPRLTAQQRRADLLALLAAWDLRPVPKPATIPAGASPALAKLLQAVAKLQAASVQSHNQWAQSLPTDATAEEIRARQQQEATLFRQQHQAELASLARQAQALATDAAGQLRPVPAPLQIPADATPQLSAFLVARDELMRADVAMQNQYAGADPAMRQAAIQLWCQQNASRLEQLCQLAQALSSNP